MSGDGSAAGSEAADAQTLEHLAVGEPQKWWSFRLPYLTADEVRELTRVAAHTEPVELLHRQTLEARRRRLRGRTLMRIIVIGFVVDLVAFYAGFVWAESSHHAPGAVLLLLGCLAAFLVLGLLQIPVLFVSYVGDEQFVVGSLLAAVRSAVDEAQNGSHLALRLHLAAEHFYLRFHRGRRSQRGPAALRRIREQAARRGAAALSSYISLLDCVDPDYGYVADQMRRAILRVSAGHWRQVEELAVAGQAVWTPPGLLRRLGAVFSRESTQKVAVAVVVSLIAILAAAVTAAIKR